MNYNVELEVNDLHVDSEHNLKLELINTENNEVYGQTVVESYDLDGNLIIGVLVDENAPSSNVYKIKIYQIPNKMINNHHNDSQASHKINFPKSL